METSDIRRFPALTTNERLSFCDMLDMWCAVANGTMELADTPEYALKVSAERGVPVCTLQGYMQCAKEVAARYNALVETNDSSL